MEFAAIAMMGAAVWWFRPNQWRVATYEETFPLSPLVEVEETEENRAKGLVEEDTPEGKVRMRRTGDVFEYWSPRAMAYRYLEPVARKHVLVYGGTYTKMRATVKEVEAHKGVFAAFKTYKEVCKEVNKYRWLGKEEEEVRVQPKAISFADFKNKQELKKNGRSGS